MKEFNVLDLINNVQQGITVFDEELKLIACNANFIKFLDFPANFAKSGTPLINFFRYNAEQGEYGEGDPEVLAFQRYKTVQNRLNHTFDRERLDGTIVEVQGSFTTDNWLVTTYTDVTAIRKAERYFSTLNKSLDEENQLQAQKIACVENELAHRNHTLEIIIENTKHGISLFDKNLNLQACNKRFCELMEFPLTFSKPGTPMQDMFAFNAKRGEYGDGDMNEQIAQRLELAKKFEAHKFDRIRPDGTVIEIIGTPTEKGFVTTYTDITELRNIQIKLEEASQNLQEKVNEQTREIKEKQSRVEEFAEAASDWFWETDVDNIVTFISKRFEQITGMKVSDVIGLKRNEVSADGVSSIQWQKHLEILDQHKSFRNFKYKLKSKTGQVFSVSISGVPIFIDNDFVGYRGTGTNITNEVNYVNTIQETEQWLAAYFQHTPLAVIQWDADKNIVQWNSKATELFKYDAYEALGASFDILISKENAPLFEQAFAEILSKADGEKLQLAIERKDHETRICEWHNTPMRSSSGEVTSVLSIIEDITVRVQTQAEIIELNKNLEARVKERTHELTRSNTKLEDTVELLQLTQNELVEAEKMASLASLVGGVAHEVNTPLGVCITAASYQTEQNKKTTELIETGKLKKSDLENFMKTSAQSSSILELNLNRAASLIKSFKQVAVDQSSEEIRTIDLQDYFEEILSSLHPQIKKTKITVNLDIPMGISFETYPGAIAQIITNLLMNSLIHAFAEKEAGEISICAEQNSDKIHILYSDTGKGMTSKIVKNIFEPFFTTKRNEGGSGLGMHIAYNLITQRLKGTIKCISSLGKGTQFILSIPLHLENNT